MSSLMTSMYTGVSGLMVNQVSLNTTAHNIANVDTPGYVRQQILTNDFLYRKVGDSSNSFMQVGLGTSMAAIRQVRCVFLDKSYRLELGRQEFYESQQETVAEIESVFGEPNGEAFKDCLNDLWTAVSEMAKEPDNIVTRGVLVTTAENFLRRAEIISKQLNDYQTNLNKQIKEKVDRINEIGDKILGLNETIRKLEASGQQPNDYRDTRNSLLDELGGLVNISYREEMNGEVTVLIENIQFVSDNKVNHLDVQRTIMPEEQEKADEINRYTKEIADIIEAINLDNVNYPTLSDKVKAINERVKNKSSSDTPPGASEAWNALKQYGNITITADGAVKFNEFTLVSNTGKAIEYLPAQSDLLTVIWKGKGYNEVFRLDGNYSSAANTDVGSLKGLLVSRGSVLANYTSIPKVENYKGGADDPQYIADVKTYNKYIEASAITATQAQFDQLLNTIITAINDVLCPNTEVNTDVISNILTKTQGSEVDSKQVDMNTVKITLADGTELELEDGILIFDAMAAGCGMDENKTQGEALFERRSMERYTKGTLTVKVGIGEPTGTDADGNNIYSAYEDKEIDVLIYNQEYSSNNYSLFTVGQIELNERVLNDYNLIPLSANRYSGQYGAFNQAVCEALIDLWDNQGLKLDPNTLTYNNFQDYYTAMTGAIAYRGVTYRSIAKNQNDMVEGIDNKRLEIMGTSSDEELTNLIKYQHAYNASSRYINVINEMLGHVIDRLGH